MIFSKTDAHAAMTPFQWRNIFKPITTLSEGSQANGELRIFEISLDHEPHQVTRIFPLRFKAAEPFGTSLVYS
jgi:hypothetical protein